MDRNGLNKWKWGERKRGPGRASGEEVGSIKLTVLIVDDAFEVGFIEDLFVFSGAEQEGTATDVVDLAGDAFGVVIDTGEEAIAKDLVVRASDPQVVLDVGDGFQKIKGLELVADGDALLEGLIGGEAEEVGQVGLTEQDQGEQGGGVHLVVEQEAELVEDVRRQAMGLIKDEQEGTALAGQVGQGGAQLGQEAVEGVSWLDLQGQQDLAVEGGQLELGVGQISDRKQVVVEAVDKGAQGGGLTGADPSTSSGQAAGDESGQAFLEGKGEPTLDFLMAGGREEVGGGDGPAEGGLSEAVIIIEGGHQQPPERGPEPRSARWGGPVGRGQRVGRSGCLRVEPQ